MKALIYFMEDGAYIKVPDLMRFLEKAPELISREWLVKAIGKAVATATDPDEPE